MNQMKPKTTVESRVLEILMECPASRYDDMILILHYYNRFGYIKAGNLPLEDIVFNYRALGLPCFETIRRARQRVQSLFPEVSRHPIRENAETDTKDMETAGDMEDLGLPDFDGLIIIGLE